MSVKLSWEEFRQAEWDIEYVSGYLTDNSCSDPDCCGGPFYDYEEYVEAKERLAKFGIILDEETLKYD